MHHPLLQTGNNCLGMPPTSELLTPSVSAVAANIHSELFNELLSRLKSYFHGKEVTFKKNSLQNKMRFCLQNVKLLLSIPLLLQGRQKAEKKHLHPRQKHTNGFWTFSKVFLTVIGSPSSQEHLYFPRNLHLELEIPNKHPS
jgi:hypothetical protein